MLLIVVKVALTALVVVSATIVAERLKPIWAGILTTIPLSSGAAFVMLALSESPAFLSDAALAALVTSIAAYAYLAVFVSLAPRRAAFASVSAAFLTWLAFSTISYAFAWSLTAALLGNLLAYAACRIITRSAPDPHVAGRRASPTRRDLLLRGLAVGLLATVVSISGRYVGPTVAGTLAVFPMVYVTVAFIVHRRAGGAVAAATMGSAATPLVGVSLAFFTLAALATVTGSLAAMLAALAVTMLWPLMLALRHLHLNRAIPA
ncbi:hypothetical protein P1X14_09900 [Sphingomonas sp. AOB5]|uniref:hypothetical protein n=1 Tax=Sphingomonas sp. AOB5 TaxID=3034017 RepID=UPI0023F84607|nr:hypothetical protein [Sphingomonas sp. AOB5]MDF7775558.1 hypothetical protein [Sphingomonas sp. AOB5]